LSEFAVDPPGFDALTAGGGRGVVGVGVSAVATDPTATGTIDAGVWLAGVTGTLLPGTIGC
jgi:hypothetical protein